MSEFLEYIKMFYSRIQAKMRSKVIIIQFNVMPELDFPPSIVRSGALFQSLKS